MKRDVKAKLAVSWGIMAIGFYYARGLIKDMLTCHCPPSVSEKVRLGGYRHSLVL